VSIIYINPYQFAAAGVAYDTDAQAYITAVEAADGQALETGVRDAINAFVVNCKADGCWPAIKASCILSGARTLSGALVPLAGAAPTNLNFVSGDYDRKTGLEGNGISKSLDSNRACSSDSQDNVHAAVYASSRDTGAGRYIGGVQTGNSLSIIGNTTGFRARVQSSTITTHGTNTSSAVLIGVSRSNSSTYSWIDGAQSGSASITSAGISAGNYFVFATNAPNSRTLARLAFYSIGESLDLALLDARVTTLINAFAAAIP
jgi:hypothetical protein